ncbi:carbohydrate ABC transporter permease [Salipaludibacillus agaradhaerens]|uniref:carbohydrate ABC transporter permease n=1 Tax=Salipaludibacillus agaradhaerens TaxID=76935 RepID=UPI0021510B2E|nr:carbohydrate ABC transporter permease [Salipaludibacillus agaradhaerens]MCR6108161.1 carbohydrate ABC transporter permease [Salipaludibacillus agaradhaerens]MCR6120186.1 carbohydrate ABC transporter permease [Salipaludibacillus agaradhaerens]UJW59216.1 carbohydrate ABC transporter permease [Bacillus sp. A116_S68]
MEKTLKEKMITCLLVGLFILVAFVALFPVISLVVASLSPASDLMRYGLSAELFFSSFDFQNFQAIFGAEGSSYWQWYMNSIIISAILIVLSLFFSSLVGYALAVYEFKGKRFVFILVLLILMIPFEILMLPLFRMMTAFSLVDSYFAVMLPLIVAPIAVFFFRQYSVGLPKELMEAARIDGCTEYGIFFRIMAPLMLPSFAAMAILQGLTSWNNFLWPLLVLRSNDMFTLPIGLATLLTPYGNNYQILFAGSVLSIIPIIILFLFFQRFFIAGLTSGGVKG